MAIDLSDLLDEDVGPVEVLPNGTTSPYTPEHAEAAAKVLGYDSAAQRDEADPPKKRKRRTKAEMEAARNLEAFKAAAGRQVRAFYVQPSGGDDTANIQAALDAISGVEQEVLPDFEIDRQQDARDTALLSMDEPDATDAQVLVDELHFLREDIRELSNDIRKLTLAVDRAAEARPKEPAGGK